VSDDTVLPGFDDATTAVGLPPDDDRVDQVEDAQPATGMPSSEIEPDLFAGPRDEAWFDALFTANTTLIYRYFARRGPLDDAEDLTADVFTTAWRRRDVIPSGAELPWLYQTAGYILANHRRKGRPEPVADVPDDTIGDDDPADLAVNDDELKLVLGQLTPRDRRILLLHAWEGLDGDALAVALGISRGGADAALSRARARLRAAWGDREASS